MAVPDSEVRIDGQLLDLIDAKWREDTLPDEDIEVPIEELPETEQVSFSLSHFHKEDCAVVIKTLSPTDKYKPNRRPWLRYTCF